jgi:hypothetical protein
MDELEFWCLADALSLTNAAALICDIRPSLVRSDDLEYENGWVYVSSTEGDPGNDNFRASLQCMITAIQRGILTADVQYLTRQKYFRVANEDQGVMVSELDPTATTVDRADLCEWLEKRGLRPAFFFPKQVASQPGYLERSNPRYAPKLAAAVDAWNNVSNNPDLWRVTSPKNALSKWLNENASAYGLTKDDGTPNATAVEEIAKVANWKPEGGANKTPGD